ncbi:MAG: response regulator transcription factor [Phoenicibacter congonensis]|uniref:Response regulator transcription factor n=1 Tax=Phoenicibacter congonensis TaxID=1944646 RepID=A0AA43RHU0_9ACTN|nr:response regulator transcription factor [Phoenicibacter congonensis]
MKKKVLFVADTVDCAKKFADVLKAFDIELMTCRYDQAFQNSSHLQGASLVIFEIPEGGMSDEAVATEKFSSFGSDSILFVCPQKDVDKFRLPVHLTCDFVVSDASEAEVSTRIKNLLYPGTESSQSEIITCGNMTLNIGTYQVHINDTPLDLTYLEYALLAFLVTHPKHSYSRDELLKRVWGFDYLGGSRTVDVHIRRIRAKIGPENASKLETVRGVGYLWNA